MPENVYEGMFILDPNRYAREAAEIATRIPKMIEKQGGTMLVNRMWEERRLAYPVKGHRKGTYWLTYFRLDSSKLVELVEQVQRNDAVLRHLIVRVEPRIVDTLVEHALSGTVRTAPPAAAATDVPKDGAASPDQAPVPEEAPA